MKAPQRPRGPIGPPMMPEQQQQQQDNKNNNGAGVDDPPTGADYTEFIAALRFTSPRRTIRCLLLFWMLVGNRWFCGCVVEGF